MCTVIFDAVDVFEEFYILVRNHKVERRIGTRAFRFYVALLLIIGFDVFIQKNAQIFYLHA